MLKWILMSQTRIPISCSVSPLSFAFSLFLSCSPPGVLLLTAAHIFTEDQSFYFLLPTGCHAHSVLIWAVWGDAVIIKSLNVSNRISAAFKVENNNLYRDIQNRSQLLYLEERTLTLFWAETAFYQGEKNLMALNTLLRCVTCRHDSLNLKRFVKALPYRQENCVTCTLHCMWKIVHKEVWKPHWLQPLLYLLSHPLSLALSQYTNLRFCVFDFTTWRRQICKDVSKCV